MKTLRERPIQIYLRTDQDKALRQMAEKEKVSIAELVRRGVDRLIADLPVEHDPAMALVALGRSGKADAARGHDRYLARARHRKHKR